MDVCMGLLSLEDWYEVWRPDQAWGSCLKLPFFVDIAWSSYQGDVACCSFWVKNKVDGDFLLLLQMPSLGIGKILFLNAHPHLNMFNPLLI